MEKGNRDIIRIQISHKFYQIIKGILCSTVLILPESYTSASMLSREICLSGLIEEFYVCSCLCMHAGLCLCMLKAVNFLFNIPTRRNVGTHLIKVWYSFCRQFIILEFNFIVKSTIMTFLVNRK